VRISRTLVPILLFAKMRRQLILHALRPLIPNHLRSARGALGEKCVHGEETPEKNARGRLTSSWMAPTLRTLRIVSSGPQDHLCEKAWAAYPQKPERCRCCASCGTMTVTLDRRTVHSVGVDGERTQPSPSRISSPFFLALRNASSIPRKNHPISHQYRTSPSPPLRLSKHRLQVPPLAHHQHTHTTCKPPIPPSSLRTFCGSPQYSEHSPDR
jgi:hypothetical protein